MTALSPILACERSAAKLLDMKPSEFRELVSDGILPQPRLIARFERWDVEELRQIGRADAVLGMDGVKW